MSAIDTDRLLLTLRECVEVDSPVGYFTEIHEWLRETVEELGYTMTVDAKRTAYVEVAGKDTEHTVCIGAHLDTIGLVVRGFNDDGTLRVRALGGINYASIEGETCYIHCRDGQTVVGQVICNKHSVHVWDDVRTTLRDENTMSVSVIGDVASPEDARALGITEGAIIGIDPHFESFDNGYIVTRHIDDKAAVAVAIDTLHWLAETKTTPAFNLLFAFPLYEEIGHGGAWVPTEVDEYVAIDVSLIGPDYDANEHHTAVIAADARGPYDWELTNVLRRCAEKACDADKWNTQVCFRYSTDAQAAYTNANNLINGAFGMACLNTHGRERCHIDALVQTALLCRAFVMGEGRAEEE